MALTEKRIAELEAKGFTRWTKGNFDRLYINASALGLVCTYYKSGNISSAEFNGHEISNSEGYRMKSAKTFIDIKTGSIHSDNSTLEEAVQKIVAELDEQETAEQAAELAAETAETVEEVEESEEAEAVPTTKYFMELTDTHFILKDTENHDVVHSGLLADAGITEDPDPEYACKLDDYLLKEFNIQPDEWVVG